MPDASPTVRPTALAVGGDAIARAADGRVLFITGALPGEELVVRVDEQKADFGRASIVEIVEAAPERVEPSCPHVAAGCGGCGWQHVAADAQPGHKRAMVIDALRRTGKVADAEDLVVLGPPLRVGAHRGTVRAAVHNGRAGFRAAKSNRTIVVDSCEVAHPVIEHVLVNGRFGRATEVTVRVGESTGDVLVLVDPSASGVSLPPLPDDWARRGGEATIVGVDAVRRGTSASLREVVDGVEFRVSATSFFQTRLDGAELLIELVEDVLRDNSDVLVDLYGGVGLFAGTVGRRFRTVVTVEQHAAASDDAVLNLAHLPDAYVVNEDVDTWRPAPRSVRGRDVAVVADPSRKGLGRDGVATIAQLAPSVLALVSCDAGSLGRDTRLLRDAGYRLTGSTLVDLFPQTPHVEVVSRFVPVGN